MQSDDSTDHIQITDVDEASPLLQAVIDLSRTNSATLGYLPEGAYLDAAAKGYILIALLDDRLVGYLLYRVAKARVSIVHLCVEPSLRKKGVARKLFSHLSAMTKQYRGIGLHCRRDFAAHKFWPRLGFSAQYTKPGRKKEGSELTYWWIDHHRPDLFSVLDATSPDDVIEAAVDANIFHDLEDASRPASQESRALIADWIRPYVKLFLTEEMMNEADRLDKAQRESAKKKIRSYPRLKASTEQFQEASDAIRLLFPDKLTFRDESDLRHLAWTVASGTLFFVTRDRYLLEDIADDVYDAFGVSILRPVELIIRLDELYGEVKSQPRRLAGTRYEMRPLRSARVDELAEEFCGNAARKQKSEFKQRLRTFLANPTRYECLLIAREDRPYVAYVFDRDDSEKLRIPLFQLVSDPVALTIASTLMLQFVKVASLEERTFVQVSDPSLNLKVALALQEDRFTRAGDTWTKTTLAVSEGKASLIGHLKDLTSENEFRASSHRRLAKILRSTDLNNAPILSEIERELWPAKIIDAEIPTFIISIKPPWAEQLFDEDLANQSLFGAQEHLGLSRESVYYRKKRNHGGVGAPGRILWYVSRYSGYPDSKHLRACSRLDEVTVGTPGVLFKKFRRLGVYKWNHVFETAENDPEKEIMAIRFSDTELFSNPISWAEVQKVLKKDGVNSQLLSPTRVSKTVFETLYRMGIQPG